MGKIVVLASAEDSEAVKTALEGASLDFDVIEPTAANLLHIVIGMVDTEAPKEDEEPKPEEEPEDGAEELPPEEDAGEVDEEPVVEESLGTVVVDGEKVSAYKGKGTFSTFFVKSLSVDAKTTYSVNESVYSFWPEAKNVISNRMVVEHNKHRASIDLKIQESKKKDPYILIGDDLLHIFK
jgi:hypothetical protein